MKVVSNKVELPDSFIKMFENYLNDYDFVSSLELKQLSVTSLLDDTYQVYMKSLHGDKVM